MNQAPGDLLQRSDPLRDATWDAKVEASPGATFFHSSAWARVLYDTYGYSPYYLHSGPDTASPVLLPVMEVDSWLTGRRGISLPFTDECDALCAEARDFTSTFKELLSFAARRRWKYYELRGAHAMEQGAPPSVSYFGHTLDLQRDTQQLFARFDSAVRRAIRKSEQEGVSVQFSQDLPAIRAFYDLVCVTRARQGLPPQPFRFFENIHRHILQTGRGTVALAQAGGKTIAGAVYFQFKQTVLYKFGASDERFQRLRGNNLVMWKAIERYAEKGFTQLDFGRTSLANEGLRRFKLSWGSQERPIDYVRYDIKGQAFIRSADESTASWRTALFRSLPTGLSRLIGAAAYRHIA